MDGLLEAKSEPKRKFLLRTVHEAGGFKLSSLCRQTLHLAPSAHNVLITSMLYYLCNPI